MTNLFNTNSLHNLLNFLIALIPALHAFDWSAFFDAETSLKIVGALGIGKILINTWRDGVTGLTKQQPPVQ